MNNSEEEEIILPKYKCPGYCFVYNTVKDLTAVMSFCSIKKHQVSHFSNLIIPIFIFMIIFLYFHFYNYKNSDWCMSIESLMKMYKVSTPFVILVILILIIGILGLLSTSMHEKCKKCKWNNFCNKKKSK